MAVFNAYIHWRHRQSLHQPMHEFDASFSVVPLIVIDGVAFFRAVMGLIHGRGKRFEFWPPPGAFDVAFWAVLFCSLFAWRLYVWTTIFGVRGLAIGLSNAVVYWFAFWRNVLVRIARSAGIL